MSGQLGYVVSQSLKVCKFPFYAIFETDLVLSKPKSVGYVNVSVSVRRASRAVAVGTDSLPNDTLRIKQTLTATSNRGLGLNMSLLYK